MIPLRDSGYILRPFEVADAEPFVAAILESQSTVGKWMTWAKPTYSSQDALEWFANCSKAFENDSAHEFGIFTELTAEFVGGAGANQIIRNDQMCNIGYWIRESRQRQGAATAAVRMLSRFAFESLKLTRAEIVVAEGNTASMRVAKRAGARHECVARNRLVINGVPSPAHIFSLVPSNAA